MISTRAKRAAVAVAAALALSGIPGTHATPTKPNVVVIMTDDQTLEQMRVMGATRSLVGDAGATFRNSYVSFPLCCPSRATFLTGQYAHNHGVIENEEPTGGYYRLDYTNSLPVWLQEAGYRTIHVGKYLNDYGTKDPTEVPPGWSDWYATVDPSTYLMWGYTLNENGTLHTYGELDVEDPALYQTDVLRDKAVAAIHDAAGAPFFLTFWTLAPHQETTSLQDRFGPRPAPRHVGTFDDEPLPRPPSFNEQNMRDKPLYMQLKPSLDAAAIAEIEERYRFELGSLLAVDEAVAALIDALAGEGILEETYVIFASDNGYFHGEHRTPTEKLLAYEPSVKVPLMMRGPGIPAGTLVDELVANVDLAPTIAALTGAEPSRTMDGRSLLSFIADPGLRTRRPVLLESFLPIGGSALRFFTEQLPGGAPVAGPTDALPLGQAVLPYQGIHTGRYVYVEYLTGERELYDLVRDPWQLRSAHLDLRYARTLLALTVELQRLRLCAGSGCQTETGPIPDPAM